MKLAEALAERADCQKKIERLKNRLATCVRVQEGEQPAEDPQALLKELRAVHEQMKSLVLRINRTNSATEMRPGATLADALAERDYWIALRTSLLRVIEAASIRADRMTRSEIKYISAVPVAELQQEADRAAREHRLLDTRIQESNWTVELLD